MKIIPFIEAKVREKFPDEAGHKAFTLAFDEVAKWFSENLDKDGQESLVADLEQVGNSSSEIEVVFDRYLDKIEFGKMRLLDRVDYFLTILSYSPVAKTV